MWCQHRCGDLHRGDRQDHQDRRPRIIARVEDPQLQQHQRVGDQGEGRQGDRHPQVVGVDLAELPVGEQRGADRRAGHRHEGHHRDEGDHGEPGRQGQVGEHRRVVSCRGIATQTWHHHRQDGHADHPERQLQHQPGVVVDRRTGCGRGAGDLIADHQTHLADQHVQHHGGGHRSEPFEPVVDTPQRSQADPFPADGHQQNRGLGHDAQSGADTEHQQLGVAHPHRVDRKFARDKQIQPEGRDGDDVVDHRRPSGRPEDVAVVQDCHEDRCQPVEDHLRQKQIGERRRQGLVHLRIGAEHQPHQQRPGRHRQHGGDQQNGGGQRHQPAHERLAAVGVVAFGAGQDRDEDRREGGLQNQGGDQVRQLIGHREGTGQGGAQNGSEQDDPDETGDPADQRGQRHPP